MLETDRLLNPTNSSPRDDFGGIPTEHETCDSTVQDYTEIGEDELERSKPENSSLVIFCLSCITFVSCYLGGLVTVCVPQIAKDLQLNQGMELWCVSCSTDFVVGDG